MSNEAIAAVAHDVVAINRSTARKAVEAQCKGVLRLIDAPTAVLSKAKESLNGGTPLNQFAGNLDGLGNQVRHQTEALLENYGRVAGEVIDWMSDRADTGIAKVDETLLSRGGPVLDRVLLPGVELLRRVAQQTASLTERVAGLVIAENGPAVVSETADVVEEDGKPRARKSTKAAHH